MTPEEVRAGLLEARRAIDVLIEGVAGMETGAPDARFRESDGPSAPRAGGDASGGRVGAPAGWTLPAAVGRAVEQLAADLGWEPAAVLVLGVSLVLAQRTAAAGRRVLLAERMPGR
ncbi:MAG TPA: hypothetical protein VMI54_03795 [Polyangiaceae bacterium]|nr:hypothetical protein [Polyangiaceae bacterium]